jgi:hypothetical protein
MSERVATEDFDDDVDEDIESDESDQNDLDDADTDNIGDPSIEINVEDLIHELEADGLVSRIDKEKNTRKRLEELMERKRAMRELEDFDDYEI